MTISIKSPTRVDLAGGTLDLWPIYSIIPNSVTVNLSIDIFTYCELKPKNSKQIELDISDLNYVKTFQNINEVFSSTDSELTLIKVILNHFKPTEGFYMRTQSDSPIGGGLGGSSSLMVSIIKAFEQWRGEHTSIIDKALVARDLEAQVLNTPTGIQDYIPAGSYGLNIIKHNVAKPEVKLAEIDENYFTARMFLVDTGKAHHSGLNNWQTYKAFIDGDEVTKIALHRIRDIGLEMQEVCLNQKWGELTSLFKKEFAARMMLSESFSSPEIEKLEKLVLQHGADAAKICGAGGGGSVLVWTSPEHKQKVMDACEKEQFRVLKIKPITTKK